MKLDHQNHLKNIKSVFIVVIRGNIFLRIIALKCLSSNSLWNIYFTILFYTFRHLFAIKCFNKMQKLIATCISRFSIFVIFLCVCNSITSNYYIFEYIHMYIEKHHYHDCEWFPFRFTVSRNEFKLKHIVLATCTSLIMLSKTQNICMKYGIIYKIRLLILKFFKL